MRIVEGRYIYYTEKLLLLKRLLQDRLCAVIILLHKYENFTYLSVKWDS